MKPIQWPTVGAEVPPHSLVNYVARCESARPSLGAWRARALQTWKKCDSTLRCGKVVIQRQYEYQKGDISVYDDGFTLVAYEGRTSRLLWERWR